MPEIIVKNMCKSYDMGNDTVRAVDDVSLAFSGNEAVAVIGPSGSGKSTLLNMIGLILRPDSGSLMIDDKNIEKYWDREKSAFRNQTFGYIFQDFALLNDETVYRNIRLPLLYNKSIKRKEYKKRITDAAESLHIADKLHRNVNKLSGGERQRVAIARAIVCDQPIILADEPTGSLDAANRENVMNILMELCKKQNKLLIIVTHDLSVAKQCDRVIQMKDGHIIS
ncbi:MAG: ABC transporter ATP-binding protein [Lachnospiraceae bacterium]